MENKFKVGDGVMYIGAVSDLYGNIGTVIEFNIALVGNLAYVHFDNYGRTPCAATKLKTLVSCRLIDAAKGRQAHDQAV